MLGVEGGCGLRHFAREDESLNHRWHSGLQLGVPSLSRCIDGLAGANWVHAGEGDLIVCRLNDDLEKSNVGVGDLVEGRAKPWVSCQHKERVPQITEC